MVDTAALVRAFEHYAGILLSPYDVADVLHELVDQAVDVLGVDGAGVCLAGADDRLRFAAATDSDVAVIEEHQVVEDEGPCHDAHATGRIVTSDDLDTEPRWPSYVTVARRRGAGSVAGLPMPVERGRIGALNLYRTDAHAWHERELEVGQLLANMASGYLVNHAELGSRRELAAQLRHALDSRVVIERAKGILSGRHDITPAEAFTRLRSTARRTNTGLHELCHRVVDGDLDLPAA